VTQHDAADPVELPARALHPVAPFVPTIKRLVHGYFRSEVHGFEHVPDGPVLFVGNHSGGAGSPDSVVFILEFLDRFGVDRPLYWLAHDLLMQLPLIGTLIHRAGVVSARPEVARDILRKGGSVVVYPGGEIELHRPWTERNRIKFQGRTGFLRLARDAGVPIVPVVAHGGHNTYLPISDGTAIAHRLRLDRLFKLRTFPITVSAPFGLVVGDLLAHIPLPARIQVELLEPIDVASEFGDDLDAAYEHVVAVMQTALDTLATRGTDEDGRA
jgi:1-acyl-sn-glycerol-3-phosphate acyltransferase